MKRTLLILFTMVIAGIFAAPGFAEITPGRVSVSPFFGWYVFDHDMNLKDRPVAGFRVGYDLTDRWGVEGAFDYVKTKFDRGSGDVKVYGYRLDALYHFRPKDKLVPFLAAGIGGTNADYPDNTGRDGNDFLLNYGGGVKYFLSEALALRADIRHLLVFDGGRSDWEYTIGVTFFFGGGRPAPAPAAAPVQIADADGDGVPDALDRCPDTPKGVKVDKDGCPVDSDGDGVPDYLDRCPDTPKGAKVDKDGCPIVAKTVEKAPEKVSIALQIEFDTSKAVIKPQYDVQIKKVADFMKTYPETSAVIEGHTDNVGKEEYNQQLSLKRAESVKAYLVEKFGIAPGRLSAKGFGSSQPVASNATAEGRAKNRRINAVFETMTKR
ncbi:MAG TPA: OmpA family protein [Nitrospirota bacterium]|nr:OmpA family protein [Nitrospirota bacterium]